VKSDLIVRFLYKYVHDIFLCFDDKSIGNFISFDFFFLDVFIFGVQRFRKMPKGDHVLKKWSKSGQIVKSSAVHVYL
jgi:hypothetical protein